MNKEEITAWRVIYQILKETGYDKLYEDEINCIVNALWRLKNTQNNWNELKEWLEKELVKMNPQKLNIGEFNLQNDDMNMGRYLTIQRVNELMQEIESRK